MTMTASRLAALAPLALVAALAGCGDDAQTALSPPLPHLVCGDVGVSLGVGDGLVAALCRPGADPDGAAPIGVITLEYDASGRVDGLRLDDDGGLRYTVALDWDASGRLSELAEDLDGDGQVDQRTRVDWTGDAVTGLTTDDREGTPTRFVSLDYQDGRLTGRSVTNGEGKPLTFEYFTWQEGHVTHRMLKSGGDVPLELADYGADGDGHVTSRHVVDGGGGFLSDTTWDWNDGRLAGRSDLGADGSSVIATADFTYDGDGRLTDIHRAGRDSRDLAYARDAQGRVDQVVISGPAND